MPKIIIKSGADAPTNLQVADSELAFSRTNGKLYVGKGTTAGGAASSVVELGPVTIEDKTEKTTTTGDDLVLIADSQASGALKKAKRSTIVSGLATSGAVGSSGLTQSTGRLLGRTSASTGAIEEIEAHTGLALSATRLSIDIPGLTEKNAAAAGDDLILIADSANSNSLRKIKRSNLVSGVGTGTVTSVGLSLDANLFTAESDVITGTGSLDVTLSNRNANLVFAGPSTGSAAKPSFRALVSADLPDIDGGTY